MSDKNFDPGMKDTCELKEAWADGKKLYYVEDIPGLLEQITCLNKQLAKANELVAELEREVEECDNINLSLSFALNVVKDFVTTDSEEKNVCLERLGTIVKNEQIIANVKLNKFAIEKKIEALESFVLPYKQGVTKEYVKGGYGSLILKAAQAEIEQLRKEQE